MKYIQVSEHDGEQIAEILSRRANEIAGYSGDKRGQLPASVDLALDREIKRLRNLADRVTPPKPPEDDF